MIKLILTNSLYPQIAIEDEFNSSKTVSEKLYHTMTKNFIFLKPMSYFASNPEILELHIDDIEEPPHGKSHSNLNIYLQNLRIVVTHKQESKKTKKSN